MEAVKAIILGIIQGLTEFLPVSSSGHLVLGQKLAGLENPEILFDVVLHCGTLLAVFIIFRREILDLLLEFLALPQRLKNRRSAVVAWRERPNFRMLALIIAGSIPTGLLGIGFKDLFESLFSSTLTVGLALLATGLVLYLSRLVRVNGRGISGFRTWDALFIGLAQGLAITPGLSRSGLTISAGLFLGLEREMAFRFSFLLSIPAILGALLLEVRSASQGTFGALEFTAGFLAAVISGLIALILLRGVVRRGSLHWFAYYCWLAGLVALTLSVKGG